MSYRLPNGDVITNFSEYFDAWAKYRDVIPLLFPGYTVISFDPGILMGRSDPYDSSVDMPLFVLDKFIELLGNPEFFWDKSRAEEMCTCGHSYSRHFDWGDDDRYTGCKYSMGHCGCKIYTRKTDE